MKKSRFFKFEFFKFLLQVEVVSCIVNFDNNNYEFIEIFIRFFFTHEFLLDVDFKFSFKHIHFEIVVSIRFVKIYLKTLNIINCRRFLN